MTISSMLFSNMITSPTSFHWILLFLSRRLYLGWFTVAPIESSHLNQLDAK